MLNDIMEKFKGYTAISQEDFEQFMQILELPDDKFIAAQSMLSSLIATTTNSPEVETELLKSARSFYASNSGPVNLKEEKQAFEDFLAEIENDDSIIKEKRDFLINFLTPLVEKGYEYLEVPRQRVQVDIELTSAAARLPEYAHNTDAGADVFASEDVTIQPGETKIVSTGIKVAIPIGYAIFIYPRSGLSAKTGLRIANSVGVIDAMYHKEIGVIIQNTNNESYEIKTGDRIAQMVISEVPMIKWKETIIKDNERGGFGSTGK